MDHFALKPRTIEVGKSNQNGDVESLNGALMRKLKQHLLLRRSSDFESIAHYETFIAEVLTRANRQRKKRFDEELTQMKPLNVDRLPECIEIDSVVTSWSTIRIKNNAYSLPSRLRGESVRVRLFDDRLEIRHAVIKSMTPTGFEPVFSP